MPTEAKHPVKSTKVTFAVVEALRDLDGAGITELAEELDLPKSNVHNYLSTLCELEYVAKEGRKYYVGTQFFELGAYARRQQEIYHAAKPEIGILAEKTGEWASLVVEEHGRGTYLQIDSGDDAISGAEELLGSRIYLHCTALGKAILSTMPDERIDEIIDYHGLPAKTMNTITNRSALFDHLEEVRARGYAVDDEESSIGARCVGVPVVSDAGRVFGAISVTGPARRIRGLRWENEIPELVQEHANVVELNLSLS